MFVLIYIILVFITVWKCLLHFDTRANGEKSISIHSSFFSLKWRRFNQTNSTILRPWLSNESLINQTREVIISEWVANETFQISDFPQPEERFSFPLRSSKVRGECSSQIKSRKKFSFLTSSYPAENKKLDFNFSHRKSGKRGRKGNFWSTFVGVKRKEE